MEFGLPEIISNIITLITGGGLSWLFFWRLNKKEKAAQVDSQVVENMQRVLDEIKSRNESLHERLADIQDKLNKSEDESIQLKSDVAVLRLGFCSHQLCPLRNPAYGSKVTLDNISTELFDTKEIQAVATEKGYDLLRCQANQDFEVKPTTGQLTLSSTSSTGN